MLKLLNICGWLWLHVEVTKFMVKEDWLHQESTRWVRVLLGEICLQFFGKHNGNYIGLISDPKYALQISNSAPINN
jgi:hypothetical protein